MIPISQIRTLRPWEGKSCAQDPLERQQQHQAQLLSPWTPDSELHLRQCLHLCTHVGVWSSGSRGRSHIEAGYLLGLPLTWE